MDLIYLAATILVPIVPAAFLFKALPSKPGSTGSITGRFQGMELKFGGAFAGYFAIFFLVFHNYDILAPFLSCVEGSRKAIGPKITSRSYAWKAGMSLWNPQTCSFIMTGHSTLRSCSKATTIRLWR